MTTRVFEDDPSIAGEERLFRRIHGNHVLWDEHGNAAISSAAFLDPELSVNLESVMARDGRPPADALRKHPGFSLAAFTAAYARSLNQAVARDPRDDEPAHGVVFGETERRRIARKLRDGAQWVVTPARTE
jgi:hypothetical protein